MDIDIINNHISDDFNKKLGFIFKHYIAPPEINEENNGLFKDNLDFLTTEDIEILLYAYQQKHRFNPNYDLSNIKLIDNDTDFSQLKKYLDNHPLTTENQNFKLILKVKKGELPCWGVHIVPVYIRHEGNRISAFIHDAAFGIMYETKDGFTQATNVIEQYLKQQAEKLQLDYRIIKSSTITMADARNCPIYGKLAISYFVRFGDKLFGHIEPFLISQHDKIIDKENDHIFHVKVDGLPVSLYKYTNRRTLERMNAMYSHEWMPQKISLPLTYQFTNLNDLLEDKLNAPVGKPFGSSEGHTLGQKLALYEGKKQSKTSGHFFQYNFAADRKMNKARNTILENLNANKIVDEVSEHQNTINTHKLEKWITKIRK